MHRKRTPRWMGSVLSLLILVSILMPLVPAYGYQKDDKLVKMRQMFCNNYTKSGLSNDNVDSHHPYLQGNYDDINTAKEGFLGAISSYDLCESPISPWPMKCHDTCHTGRSPYSTADNPLVEIWRYKTGNSVEGGCIIENDGMIIFGDFAGYLYAVTPDGELHWKTKLGGLVLSTPALDEDGTIYLGTYNDHMFAVDSDDGEILWSFYAGGSISSSPAIGTDGTIYFGIAKEFDKGEILAVNPDGTEKWRYAAGDYIFADPAIAPDGTIYIGSLDGYLYAMNPDGSLKWCFKTGDWVKSHPSIGDDGTVYFSSFDGYFYALYPDGNLKWTFGNPGSGCVAAVIAEEGTLYLGGDRLYAIHSNGMLKWSFTFDNRRYVGLSSPAIGADGTIFVGLDIGEDQGGELIAINADGSLRWRSGKIAYWSMDSSPCIGVDGTVYVGSSYGIEDGFLHAFGEGTPNSPPQSPSIIGPNHGTQGTDYPYTFVSTDPDEDDMYYYIDWGDGTNSGWLGPYASGEEITLTHQWAEVGSYIIQAKVRDYFDKESAWATLEVTMPKERTARFFFKDVFNSFRILLSRLATST